MDAAGQRSAGCDVSALADGTIVLDDGSGVNDAPVSNPGTGVDDRTWHQCYPFSEYSSRRNARSFTDRTGQLIPDASQKLNQP